jgi:hypothetical protein
MRLLRRIPMDLEVRDARATVTNPDGPFPLEFEDAVVAAGPGDTAGPARDTTIIMSSR